MIGLLCTIIVFIGLLYKGIQWVIEADSQYSNLENCDILRYGDGSVEHTAYILWYDDTSTMTIKNLSNNNSSFMDGDNITITTHS